MAETKQRPRYRAENRDEAEGWPKKPGPAGAVELGPAAEAVFGGLLGIDLEGLRRKRRRFAYACVDWTEHGPHLAGALGAALREKLMQRGWVVGSPGTRRVVVTDAGKTALAGELGIQPD